MLRTPEVLFIGTNGVVAGGIFLLFEQGAERAGAAMVWAYLAVRVVVGLIGLSFAEVSTMYDGTGGPLVCAVGDGQDGGLHGLVDGEYYPPGTVTGHRTHETENKGLLRNREPYY